MWIRTDIIIVVALLCTVMRLGEKREYLQSEGYGGPLLRACDVTLFEERKDAGGFCLMLITLNQLWSFLEDHRFRSFDAKDSFSWWSNPLERLCM